MPSLVLVMIAPPGELKSSLVDDARALFARDQCGEPSWLGDGEACEFSLFARDAIGTAKMRKRVEQEVREGLFAGRPIDIAVIPSEHRRKRLLVADMESTVIAEECLDELADIAGVKERVAPITARAMRGEIPYETALRERLALLAGLEVKAAAEVLGRVTYNPGARTLVKTMKQNGAFTALVSGGFSYFAIPIAEKLGFDLQQSNALVIANGKLTGEAVPPILGRDAKRRILEYHRVRLGLDPAETLAVGDGANDIGMIEAAGLGVAFRAKPPVVAKARVSIVHGGLTALLYLQGYRRAEFAA